MYTKVDLKTLCIFLFIVKKCLENFEFLILRIFELITREVFKFHMNNILTLYCF